jgi:hypothetical protein
MELNVNTANPNDHGCCCARDMFSHRAPVTVLERLCAAVLVALVFTGVARGAPNPTCTIQVVAGQSIQAAIDGAATGATVCVGPGTYRENLLIAKDGITLKGAGPGATVLQPPAQPVPVCLKLFFPPVDYDNNGLNGICVADVDPQGNILRVVNDVRVTGFTIQTTTWRRTTRAMASLPSVPHTASSSTTRLTAAMTQASTSATRQRPTSGSNTTPLLTTSGGFSCGTRPQAA